MSGSSELNPSSLIDLKAELHKKYDTFRKAKLTKGSEAPKVTPFRSKLDPPKEKKTKFVPVIKQKAEDTEEEQTLKKSRLALEAKAKLYEKIVSNKILIDDEQNDNYLVDFQRKVLYESPEPFTQEKNIKEKPVSSCEDFVPPQAAQNVNRISSQNLSHAPEASSSNNPEQATHYQNVQFNEIRDHGTGYFAFSTDEAKRKEQMQELNSLRKDTEEQRIAKQRMLKKRKAMLQNRLAKICERKNIDPSVLDAYKTDESDAVQQTEGEVQTDLTSIPLPDEKAETEEKAPEVPKKEPKVRPWDIGKETLQNFVPAKKSNIKSQNDWLEERREERKSEFAPPTYYR